MALIKNTKINIYLVRSTDQTSYVFNIPNTEDARSIIFAPFTDIKNIHQSIADLIKKFPSQYLYLIVDFVNSKIGFSVSDIELTPSFQYNNWDIVQWWDFIKLFIKLYFIVKKKV